MRAAAWGTVLCGTLWLALPPGATAADFPNGAAAFTAPAAKTAPKVAAKPVKIPNGPGAFAPRSIRAIDERTLSAAIDSDLNDAWQQAGVTPAKTSDDAEFLRRVCLDVVGRIPTAAEARKFLESKDPEKRKKLVESLLVGPGFANHMRDTWTELLIPEAAGNFQIGFFSDDFGVWVRTQFAPGVGFDRFVSDLLTVPVTNRSPFQQANNQELKPSPFAFMAAKEGKPENLAASASRLFLGVRIECAQCHNHPFAKWKREEFWGMAAFFSGLKRQGDGDAFFQGTENATKHEIEIAGTKRVVQAAFLDGRDVDWETSTPSRKVLAEWFTSRDNPYFARATVNRVWAQYFGIGLLEPVDDLGSGSETGQGKLLDRVADQFAAHGFDMRYLVRTITSTRAYQLSSAGGSPSSDTYHLFDRMPVRGLTPLQLYNSIVQASGIPREEPLPPFVIGGDSPRRDFLERFASREEKPTEHQTSILQALTIMNGRLLGDASGLEKGTTLAAIADSFFLDTPGKIEALYLATLSRRPRPDELERLVPYVERGGPTLNPRKALGDVMWSLLGSGEFVLNH